MSAEYCSGAPISRWKNGDQKIRVAEIHLTNIAKLDRAEKRDSDAPVPELGPETEAREFDSHRLLYKC